MELRVDQKGVGSGEGDWRQLNNAVISEGWCERPSVS